MKLDIISIFPEYFAPLEVSLLGKARRTGLLDVRVHDLRRWTHDRHNTVDDTPYGGGPGMVMKPEPWGEALDAIAPPSGDAVPRLVVPTPSGRPFTQAMAAEFAAEPWLLFACGRYEGIDRRVYDEAATRMPVEEVSLGDFVLAGGEVAVLVMIEAISRLVPGVLGNTDSVTDDSFAPGAMESLLEGPVFTKPPLWRDRPVPEILLSGNHGAIARWRRDQALRRTARYRPDLLARLDPALLDKHDRATLAEAGCPVDGEDMAD
ncbi:tRNA (guanosine(37)-N1)-methyltransferase TrmD [Spirillospora sp. NPDC127200]